MSTLRKSLGRNKSAQVLKQKHIIKYRHLNVCLPNGSPRRRGASLQSLYRALHILYMRGFETLDLGRYLKSPAKSCVALFTSAWYGAYVNGNLAMTV